MTNPTLFDYSKLPELYKSPTIPSDYNVNAFINDRTIGNTFCRIKASGPFHTFTILSGHELTSVYGQAVNWSEAKIRIIDINRPLLDSIYFYVLIYGLHDSSKKFNEEVSAVVGEGVYGDAIICKVIRAAPAKDVYSLSQLTVGNMVTSDVSACLILVDTVMNDPLDYDTADSMSNSCSCCSDCDCDSDIVSDSSDDF